MAKKKRKIAVIDFETDPFQVDRIPEPFCCEFYSDEICEWFWGDDCASDLIRFLETLSEPHLIYAHNGGKFDFHFLFDEIENPALIINGRIVECHIGIHTLRDSYAILPVPLSAYEKMEFDYEKMERHSREKYKSHILEYLHSDCVSLFDLVSAFVDQFGPRMTIGGTAMRELKKLHPFASCGSQHDAKFRPYYFGGRVQCFRGGLLEGPFKLVDANSMYMAAMKNARHPGNGSFLLTDEMPETFERPFFLRFEGLNRGALPAKNDHGNLTFEKTEGEFFACSHEIEAALELGLIRIDNILECHVSQSWINFPDFVDFCNDKKAEWKGVNQGQYLIWKLLGNSGYGRFAINPENFEDWHIHRDFGNEELLEAQGFEQKTDWESIELWAKPAQIKEEDFCDVAIAASITSAARAILLRGLHNATDPIYCDTDSIICRDFAGDIHPTRLGAWDLEKTANYAAIAGKKLFALYDDPNGKAVKLSSKGGTLDLQEMIKICKGESVLYENIAPTFSLLRPPTFVKRNFTQTVDKAA